MSRTNIQVEKYVNFCQFFQKHTEVEIHNNKLYNNNYIGLPLQQRLILYLKNSIH